MFIHPITFLEINADSGQIFPLSSRYDIKIYKTNVINIKSLKSSDIKCA